MKKLVAIMFLCVIFVICAIGFTACSISNSGNTDDKGTKTEQGTNSGDSTFGTHYRSYHLSLIGNTRRTFW